MTRKRTVTHAEAADMLTAYGDRRLRAPRPKGMKMDFTAEEQVDRLCGALADDPDRDLSGEAPNVIAMLHARFMFAIAACMTQPKAPIITVPADTPDDLVLRVLLGQQLAETRLPREWRLQ